MPQRRQKNDGALGPLTDQVEPLAYAWLSANLTSRIIAAMRNFGRFSLLLIVSLLLGGAGSPRHALYLSLQEIRYQAPTLSVGFRIFSDDLEDALRAHTGRFVPVIDHWQEAETQAAIMRYLQAKTTLSLDGQAVTLSLDHIEPQQDATWIACRLSLPAPPGLIEVNNRLLLEVFDTQKNLVRIYHGQEMHLSQLDQTQTRLQLAW